MSATPFLAEGVAGIPAGNQSVSIFFGGSLPEAPTDVLLSFIAPSSASYPLSGNVISGTVSATGCSILLDSVPTDSSHSVLWVAVGPAVTPAPQVLGNGVATLPSGTQTPTISYGTTLSAVPSQVLVSFVAPSSGPGPIGGNVVNGSISTTDFGLFLDSVPGDSTHSVAWTALGTVYPPAPRVLGSGVATIPSGSQTAAISFGALPQTPSGILISFNAPTGSYPIDGNVVAGTVTATGFGILLDSVPSDSSHAVSWTALAGTAGGGGVTSVGLSMPTEFSVASSPVTSSGTLAVSKANENPNTVWSGPASGSAAPPAFRALTAADIPPVNPSGPAGGDLTGSYPDPTVLSLSQTQRTNFALIGYPTGGNVQIRFDLGALDVIGLTVPISFSPSGSGGLVAGARQTIFLQNPTGSALSVAWNSSWNGINLPSSIPSGAVWKIDLASKTASESGVYVSVNQNASGGGGGGSVTSVGLSMPGEFSVAGSPVTTSGTLAVSKENQSANQVYAGPSSGSPSAPAFRSLVAADIPFAALPTGGTAYQRLAKNSSTNYDVAWYSGSLIDASDYLANGSTLQDAMNAAAAANGTLLLPPGNLALPSGGLVLPSGFTGSFGMKGCGKNVTVLTQSNASNGVYLDCSAGQPGNTFIHCSDFTVMAANGSCGVGFGCDFGTGSVTAPGVGCNCTFENINVTYGLFGTDGNWSQQFYFRNVWTSRLAGLSGGGNSTSSGDGLVIDSCINLQITDAYFVTCYRGIYLAPGTAVVGYSEGINFVNTRIVNAYYGIYANINGFWMTNFMVDNGNIALGAGSRPIYIQNQTATNQPGCLIGGQILNNNGDYSLELNNASKTMIQNVDFTYEGGSASIHLVNATNLCSIQGCTFGSALGVLADSGTSGTKAYNNISATFTDNGSNSLVS